MKPENLASLTGGGLGEDRHELVILVQGNKITCAPSRTFHGLCGQYRPSHFSLPPPPFEKNSLSTVRQEAKKRVQVCHLCHHKVISLIIRLLCHCLLSPVFLSSLSLSLSLSLCLSFIFSTCIVESSIHSVSGWCHWLRKTDHLSPGVPTFVLYDSWLVRVYLYACVCVRERRHRRHLKMDGWMDVALVVSSQCCPCACTCVHPSSNAPGDNQILQFYRG